MNDSGMITAGLAPQKQAANPFAPLSAPEILAVVQIVRADAEFGPEVLFETIELMDPNRAELRAAEAAPGAGVPRKARATVFRNSEQGVWRLTLSLGDATILSRTFVPGARPMIQLEQFVEIEDLVRKDPAFIAACHKRGITDLSLVCVDPWSAGNFDVPGEEGRHLVHAFCWLRTRPHDNLYAHPIHGLHAVVDLRSFSVLRVDDHGVLPIPMAESNYEAEFFESFRAPLKPLDVVQPEGASFVLDGHRITWDCWSLSIGFNAREALTLHDIRYEGRPIVHRMSLAEMVVPYGTPAPAHARKNVFDIGEYGLGKLANSLKLGCDCLGHIAYLDAHLNTMKGEIFTIENAICIHEEDAGILWKHWDFRTNHAEVRRGRRLVISCICTVGNYEYASYWYFRQDGAIEFEMKATGIINTAACLPGQPSRYGTEVAPGVEGHIHQHAFCARMEMAVDGPGNSVVECDTVAAPAGPENPYGNAFYVQERVLRSEAEAARLADPATQRFWKVINPDSLNAVGKPVGYKLEPKNTITHFVAPDSPSGQRSGFMRKHLWVTALDAEERYPGGEYMNHSDGSGGLEDFVAKDRPLENTDLVLWHVFGLHHLPRAEDFPVQPCISSGFMLMPSGFFNRNPGIDLPPETNKASRNHGAAAHGVPGASSSCCAHGG